MRSAFGLALLAGLIGVCFSAPAQDMGEGLTAVTVLPTGSPSPKLPVRPTRRITANAPARIMVIGDSLSQGFAIGLAERAAERGLAVQVANRGRVSTGLARSDFHDWPADFDDLAATERPDIVVAHFGSNDMQAIVRPDNAARYADAGWEAAYRLETRRILATAAQSGAVLVWLGPAPDGNSGLGRHMQRIAPLLKAEAEASGALFLPLAAVASGPEGDYAKSIEIGGQAVTIRTADRSHFTLTGYRLVADHILDALVQRFPDLQPGDTLLAELQ